MSECKHNNTGGCQLCVDELQELCDGQEELIDHLIETCPEAKPIILAWVLDHMKTKPTA